MSGSEEKDVEMVEEESEVRQDAVLRCSELKFALSRDKEEERDNEDTAARRKELIALVTEHSMVAEYSCACESGLLPKDAALAGRLEEARDKAMAALKAEGESAEKQEGEVEVYDNQLKVAAHLALSASLPEAVDAYTKVEKLTSGKSIDRYLSVLRLCLAHNDDRLYLKHSETVAKLIDKSGDWDRRNRFRVYNGVHNFRIRKFTESAECFLSAIATFTAEEMFDYKRLVKYTILAAVVSLPRADIKKKIIDSADIRQVILEEDMQPMRRLVDALYYCEYRKLMQSLVEVMGFVRADVHLSIHANYYLRQLRTRCYSQYLRSYLSVQLSSMAREFGLTEHFIDSELSALIASGRLMCKMDKVNGVIEMKREGSKGQQFSELIRLGDLLLNRVQRLSRVITY